MWMICTGMLDLFDFLCLVREHAHGYLPISSIDCDDCSCAHDLFDRTSRGTVAVVHDDNVAE